MKIEDADTLDVNKNSSEKKSYHMLKLITQLQWIGTQIIARHSGMGAVFTL